jgi:hypothetical protein
MCTPRCQGARSAQKRLCVSTGAPALLRHSMALGGLQCIATHSSPSLWNKSAKLTRYTDCGAAGKGLATTELDAHWQQLSAAQAAVKYGRTFVVHPISCLSVCLSVSMAYMYQHDLCAARCRPRHAVLPTWHTRGCTACFEGQVYPAPASDPDPMRLPVTKRGLPKQSATMRTSQNALLARSTSAISALCPSPAVCAAKRGMQVRCDDNSASL